MAYRSMLRGHPCLIELFIGIRFERNPFIWTSEDTLLYNLIMLSVNHILNPCALRASFMYECETLSKAALKSSDMTHIGFFTTSTNAITSLTVATVSNMDLPFIPQCCRVDNRGQTGPECICYYSCQCVIV